MAIKYTSTKIKKEKPEKIPKSPKAEKASKKDNSINLKISKPNKVKLEKAPKQKIRTLKKPKGLKSESSVVLKQSNSKRSRKDVAIKGSKKNNKVVIIAFLIVAVVLVLVVASLIITKIVSNNKVVGQEIEQIYVSANPQKTDYLIGEEADYAGLKIEAIRKNGEKFIVSTNKCQITGFSTSKVGVQTITVIYEGYTTAFYINVKEPPRVTPDLVNITLDSMPKTEYKVGEWLDTSTGVILCEYADGSTHRVALINGYVYGWENVDGHGPGTYTLTVRYKENGVLVETTYEITVTE